MNLRNRNAGFLDAAELEVLGVADAVGRNILIHSTAVIVNFDEIRFGTNIRIDPFVVLSCRDLVLGSYIHIATGCGFFGRAQIQMADFSNISAMTLVYSSNDDYSGNSLMGPTIPPEFTGVEHARVEIGRHSILGARCTVLPGTILREGAAVGSGALVKGELPEWTISVGSPAKPIKERSRGCLTKELALRSMWAGADAGAHTKS